MCAFVPLSGEKGLFGWSSIVALSGFHVKLQFKSCTSQLLIWQPFQSKSSPGVPVTDPCLIVSSGLVLGSTQEEGSISLVFVSCLCHCLVPKAQSKSPSAETLENVGDQPCLVGAAGQVTTPRGGLRSLRANESLTHQPALLTVQLLFAYTWTEMPVEHFGKNESAV